MNFNATIIGQLLTFAIFVWFTMKFIWPFLLKQMKERETRIADGLAAGEKGHHELELAQKHSVELIKEGKDKAAEIITHAQKRHDEIVDEAKENARTEGNRILVAARAEIDQERQQVKEELRQQVVLLAITGAEQILMREIDQDAHREMLEKISADL